MNGFLHTLATKTLRLTERFNDYVHCAKFANGIEIASQRRIKDSKIRFTITIKAGAFNDPIGKEGTAHFLEHILYGPRESTEFEKRGGSLNAATNCDIIIIHGHIDQSPENIEFLAERIFTILTSDIDEKDYEREKRRILNEIGSDIDQPEKLRNALFSNAFKNSKSQYAVAGTPDSVSGITLQDLQIYKRKWFVAPNICMGITGISDHKKLQAILEKRLADITAAQSPPHYLPLYEAVDHRENAANVNQLYYGFLFPLPALDLKQARICGLAEMYMDKILFRKIIEELGIAYHADSASYCDREHEGHFCVRGNMLPQDADKITPEVAGIISDSAIRIDEEILYRVKTECLENFDEYIFPLFPVHSSHSLVDDLQNDKRIVSLREERALIEGITAGDVRDFFKSLLKQKPSIIAYGDHAKLHSCDDFVRLLGQGQSAQVPHMDTEPAPTR